MSYCQNCADLTAKLQAAESRTWVQCTTVSNECLGGCRSMREHDRYRNAQILSRAEAAEAENARLHAEVARLREALERIVSNHWTSSAAESMRSIARAALELEEPK